MARRNIRRALVLWLHGSSAWQIYSPRPGLFAADVRPKLMKQATAVGDGLRGIVMQVPETTKLQVTVPAWAKPGQMIDVQTESGGLFRCTIPAGAKPGDEFTVIYSRPEAESSPVVAPAPAPAVAPAGDYLSTLDAARPVPALPAPAPAAAPLSMPASAEPAPAPAAAPAITISSTKTSEVDERVEKLKSMLDTENEKIEKFQASRDVTKPLSLDELRGLINRDSKNTFAEDSRQFRRTVYMHNEWVKHRSSTRFIDNMLTIGKSGISSALGAELTFITGTAAFVVLMNLLVTGYQDFEGVRHTAPLADFWHYGPFSLPAQPLSIALPALSLLLVFRTNTAYSRWNEARTLWGGVVNNCRNVVRQANTFYPQTEEGDELRNQMLGNTALFCKALRNFLRGPKDDETFRLELYDIASSGLITRTQADACMAAANRPMFCLSAMSNNLRRAALNPMEAARIDASISTLVDLTGACERIFKSPIPLVYTRHTARFLAAFLLLLPFGLWESLGAYWNHWVTIPATGTLAFFLLGIEEIGIQIEEPFSILPLEALCNGAITATMEEMVNANENKVFAVGNGSPSTVSGER